MTDLQASAPAPEAAPAPDAAAPWQHLPPELLPHILACLPPNELACTARLVCKAAAAALSSPQHTTVRLSQPAPHGEFVRRWGGPGAMRPLTLVRRRLLLSLTAASGCLENLQWLAAHVGCSLAREVFKAAAAAGRLDVCRWLQQQDCYRQELAFDGAMAAAGAGQRAVVEWLLANPGKQDGIDLNGLDCLTSFARTAARGGHVGLTDWLLQRHGLGRDRGAAAILLEAAAAVCDLPTLQQLYHTYLPRAASGGGPGRLGPVFASAAGSPTPDWKAKVEWLEGQGAAAKPPYEACAKAASCPDALDRLTWLRGRGYPWDGRATEAAAVAGTLDALRYLLAEGCPVQEGTLGAAAGAGQLAALQQALHAHSGTFTRWDFALDCALRGGYLPEVAWLLEQQLVSIANLQYPLVLCKAAESGSEEALEWLVAQGCRMPDNDPYVPAHQGDWGTLACLRRLGCPWQPSGATFTNAARWCQAALGAAEESGDASLDGMTDLQASAPAPEAAPAPGAAALWHRLPPELLLRVLACLPPNERACTARRVCKATAAALSSPQHTTVRLSQPSPHGEFVRRWGRPGAMRSLTLVRRRLLLSLTAASGCLENLQWLAAHVGCSPTREVFEAAAAAGRLDACRWLQQQGCYMQWWALSGAEAAAGAGQRATVEWLLACAQDSGHKEDDLNSVADSTSLACSAARGGHVGTMDWLLQRRGLERDGDAAATVLVAAAEGCDLPTLQRLYHAYPQAAAGGWPDQILTSAAGSPTPDWKAKVEWLEGLGAAARSSPEACAKAASRPDALDRLSWLRGRGYPWDWRATEAVAVAGNLDALRYLLAEGCPVQESTGWAVAEARQLASLQALHAHSNTFTRWNSALAGAVRGGHLPVVAWLLEQQLWLAAHVGCSVAREVFEAAAAAGRLDACRWLQQQSCYMQWWALSGAEAAASAGQRAVVEWLLACARDSGHKEDDLGSVEDRTSLACSAARGGHVCTMDWLLQRRGLERDGDAAATVLVAAAEGCDLPTLQRLYHAYPQAAAGGWPDQILTSAAGSPTPDWKAKVEWLEGLGAAARSSPEACAKAASRPDALDRLTWLRGRGYPWDWRATDAVAVAGNLDALRYLLAKGCPVQESTGWAVAEAGQLASLQALHAHSNTFTRWKSALAGAGRGGHLPVVAWLLEQQLVSLLQCPSLLCKAANSGSVELLAWLRDRGCPWGDDSFHCAVGAGSEEALEWLVAQGCPMQEPRGRDDDPYLTAARQGDWGTLACLRRLGFPWRALNWGGGTFVNAVWEGCAVPILRRLLELGCPVDWGSAIEKAAFVDAGVLAWLQEEQRRRDWERRSQQQRGWQVRRCRIRESKVRTARHRAAQRDRSVRYCTAARALLQVLRSTAAPSPDAAAVTHDLPPELLPHLLACLPPNERACTARLVCKATAAALSSPQHTTVRLSQPSPPGEFVRRWGSPGAMRPLTLVRRRLLLSLTAASGCLENLEWLAAHVGCSLTREVFQAAAAAGLLEVCRWLQQQGCDGQGWALGGAEAAAGAGQRAVVEWLLANPSREDGGDLNGAACRARLACSAARGGHVGLMDWLLQRHGLERDGDAAAALLVAAAEGCDLSTLQRLYHTYPPQAAAGGGPVRLGPVLTSVAGSPTPDWKAKVEWLEGLGAAASSALNACTRAASRPDALDRLTWLRGRGYPWDWQATNSAAVAGNLNALRYLLVEGCPSAVSTLGAAAGAGQLASLRALHAHSGNFTLTIFALARTVRGGHLPVVAWLLEQQLVSLQQCPSLLCEAAASGSMELLAWLRDRGCPWGEDTIYGAAGAGSEEALEWLVAQGCPVTEPRGPDDDPYLMAAVQGDWATLACLRRLGWPWGLLTRGGGTFANAVANGCSVPALRRLLELGCPVEWRSAIETAVAIEDKDLGCPVDWRRATEAAEASAHPDEGVRAWLDGMTDLQASAPAPEAAPAPGAAALWQHLPPELLLRVLACLPPNERACTARLVCKTAAAALSSPQHTTVRLSQPSPPGEFVRRWGGPGAMRPLTLVRRRLLLSLTAASGCLENLQWLAAHAGCPLTGDVFAAAAAAGRLDVCRWLQQRDCYGQGWALRGAEAAAATGQRATVECLLAIVGNQDGSYSAACRTSLAYSAARGGHVGLMDWLLPRHGLLGCGGFAVDAAGALVMAAAEGCDLPTLQRLYHTYPSVAAGGGPTRLGLFSAFAAGSPTPDWQAKVEWLEGQGAAASSSLNACTRAASRPDALGRLTWLRGRGYPWDQNVTEAAAVAGNLDALRYLLAEGCPLAEGTLGAAAGAGQLASLQALHARSSTFTWCAALARAAIGGHLPVVAWLLEQQLVSLQQCLPLLPEAAQSGSMELLAWLRDRGCPWDEDSIYCAAEAGSEDPGGPDGQGGDPYLRPVRHGDWAMLACLRRVGCPWRPLNRGGGTFVTAVWQGCSVPTLHRLLELGCPVGWLRAIEAAECRADEGLNKAKPCMWRRSGIRSSLEEPGSGRPLRMAW
ncbi:hypothetical protein TSOC_009386 [Tetrabaena socialis]|uniref:F-box domain-containing protein n=1 Tax=Tetrabaena socialis TaxID=47790 RepID=A0A2J7ZW18_9CHLO|nr:hypothetical protein TSOC_009386 [Tetrabaena socialis]|eukprot:PNH04452.1 hypothetical protein TSOC_009386 [Tetrabaena socialis]